ncbi:unnamed protein product [Cylicocyclus nassatus]|uniref:Uncharacterized protein n=1 Tax=Cylicocyclus nassatus TaxID=53992 RepID=A0AA36GHY5_CYLNA|nr:unnamed protein product [Cylicocyclus nassatus]
MDTKNNGVDSSRCKTSPRKTSNEMGRRVRGTDGPAENSWIRFSPLELVDAATDDYQEDRGCPKRGTGINGNFCAGARTSREAGPSKYLTSIRNMKLLYVILAAALLAIVSTAPVPCNGTNCTGCKKKK